MRFSAPFPAEQRGEWQASNWPRSQALGKPLSSSSKRIILCAMNRRNLFFSASAAAITSFAGPLVAQDAKTPKAPAAKKEEAKPAAQAKAEKIIIPRITFHEADLEDSVKHFRRKSVECDTEKDSERRGLSCLNSVVAKAAKPVTIDLRNVSAWEAAQKIAASAGVEVTATDKELWFYQKGEVRKDTGPWTQPAAAALKKSREWQAAEKITLNRVAFAEASLEQVCIHLNERAAAAAGKDAKVPAITAEGVEKEITMDARNVKLSDVLLAVAQMAQAEISVSDGKIVLRPVAKVKE
jgi:hypothetical protein